MELKLTASINSRAPAVSALLLAAFILSPSAMAQSANGVMATYIDYKAPHKDWDLRAVNASCAAVDGDKPLDWRRSWWWAAFCGPAGPRGDAACGLCLNVTNKVWDATMTVRIVDDCAKINGSAVLGIDTVGFSEIDLDGRGRGVDGQIKVSYKFVDCEDG